MNTTTPPPDPTFPPDAFETLGFTDTPNPAHEKLARERMEAFPEKLKTMQVSFPRGTGKEQLREATKKLMEGLELTPEEVAALKRVLQGFNEQMRPFADSVRGLFQTIEHTWADIQPSIKVLEEWAADIERKPVHPKDVRDERGIKQPSPVAPFWAARPNGRRR
ncbi:hypothetical protein SEA_BONUM_4 [Gordonia phage Bonum]|uniref:Uncharacterized protein n=1 Tax=Gordonia phage Kabluna TaxID=2041511 RepID=A0A2D1GCD2_9CAUD|nr:hypothetical protein KNT75_gp04 [Gordonia phage Kabluna]ATN89525.1 hypothetical protein SEA_KABLUNA_4 [Gordonia phage Kabluna]QXN73309.1 hypothetical protein SEA_BONUM_4 [Gordonia phage Bonum]